MSQQLDGDQIHRIVEFLVRVLGSVELGGGRETVDEDEGGFGGVVGVWHLVGAVDAAEVRDADGFGVRHDVVCGGKLGCEFEDARFCY